MRKIQKDEEIFAHYGYGSEPQPLWYKKLLDDFNQQKRLNLKSSD
jgi:hypothetical protein